MPNYVMIADDLTGANANCSLMKKIGLNSASVLDINSYEEEENIQAIAVTTDSRSMFKNESYDVVKKAMEKFNKNKVNLFNKRIDSTMRGNIGVEIEAMLDSLGEDYMAIAVPVYPATGRIVVNGIMLVNGNLLLNTDAGKDTKSPVDSSNVEDILKKQFNRKIKSIYLEDVQKGKEHLEKILREEYDNKTKLLIFDGVTDKDLENIANAAINSKVNYFSVDPGPFTSKIAEINLSTTETFSKVIMTVGSVTDISIEQIKELIFTYPVNILKVDALRLATLENYKEEIEKSIVEGEKLLKEEDYLLITTTPYNPNEKRLDLQKVSKDTGMSVDDIAVMISRGLGVITSELLKKDFSFAGVFSSGGDVTVQLTKELKANMIEIKEEIIPLAAYGRLIGGELPGLRIISKGGMVGDKNAMKLCLEKLKNTLEEE
ncbi:four-carbon acid sugar kinase family protein [Miniphocaeibacter massiliensis]|uniref:four-carbon acid sugar kinase family protein n=1 Tax=Miniphocaeibacter massiliensis TaxID=2041841 RepID=UPI000C089C67|nr:four-carbon acid sugar kinase family protein [Miniphocaeibacter massiliensis]